MYLEKQIQIKKNTISNLISSKLEEHKEVLKNQFSDTKSDIGYFFLDHLLPEDIALKIYNSFPKTNESILRKSLKEYKYTAYQMDKYDPILEEILYAFQEEKVVSKISEICDMHNIFGDKSLYAGGLSIMNKNHFLKPHLDNSHDKERKNWRVLNLLYYVSPEWKESFGGNLELWPKRLDAKKTEIHSKFNRLVVMATHQKSWHSVNEVLVDKSRCCVSNYYFSKTPNEHSNKFHVTTFRGRPKEYFLDFILNMDNKLRMTVRKFFKKGIVENPHQYKK